MNKEIEGLKFRVDELQRELMVAEGDLIPFDLVSQVMKKFGQVFKKSSKRQQRNQLLNILVLKVTIDKSSDRESIELQINEEVIRYLVKEESSEEDEGASFFNFSMLNYTCFKFVIQ